MNRTVEARAVGPETAIELGFNLYVTQTHLDTVLGRTAAEAVRDFNILAECFDPKTSEGHYITALRSAGISLSTGIIRRKETLNERIQAAEEQREGSIGRMTMGQRGTGLLFGGLRMLVVGGFVVALVKLLLPILPTGSTEGQAGAWAPPVVTALGIILISSFFGSWSTGRRIRTIFREFNEAITEANREYRNSVLKEYQLAAEKATAAYREGFDVEPPPTTKGLENLLKSMAEENPLPKACELRTAHEKVRYALGCWLRKTSQHLIDGVSMDFGRTSR